MDSTNLLIYALRRLLASIPLLLAVIALNFLFLHLTPGDPIRVLLGSSGEYVDPALEQRIRERYGLNDPFLVQLLRYVGNVLRGDLGTSYFYKVPVTTLIIERLPNTLLLLVPSLILGVAIGVFLGIVAAVRAHTSVDNVITTFALLAYSLPLFWYAVLLLGVFAVQLRWLPSGGMFDLRAGHEGFDKFKDLMRHMVLPTFVLAFERVAQIQRLMRASMLEVLRQDYVTTARSKGASERRVILRHAVRNALSPVVTVVGLSIGFILTGSVIAETIFAWPGLGRLLFESVTRRDYPVMLGMLIIVAWAMVLTNFLTDIAYGLLDPRIRYD